MHFFIYGEEEIKALKARDKKLGAVIEAIGPIKRPVTPDLFLSLVESIVSQQISSKAAATVLNRLFELTGDCTPFSLNALPAENIQQCGMTMRKAVYLKSMAEEVQSGRLDLSELPGLSDSQVIKRLCALNGIGVWTAEMLLLFSMQRPDVFSYDDLAIQRGLRMIYHHRKIDKPLFEKYRKRFSPYCSVASLYLWAVAGGALGLKDYASLSEAKKARK